MGILSIRRGVLQEGRKSFFFFSLATIKIVDDEDRRGNRGDFFFSEILEILRIFFRRDVRRMKRILSSRNVFFFFLDEEFSQLRIF